MEIFCCRYPQAVRLPSRGSECGALRADLPELPCPTKRSARPGVLAEERGPDDFGLRLHTAAVRRGAPCGVTGDTAGMNISFLGCYLLFTLLLLLFTHMDPRR